MAIKILLLDTGKEWGGGTNSMFELRQQRGGDDHCTCCCNFHWHHLVSEMQPGRPGRGRFRCNAKLGPPYVALKPHGK